jgi:hypothetical protein
LNVVTRVVAPGNYSRISLIVTNNWSSTTFGKVPTGNDIEVAVVASGSCAPVVLAFALAFSITFVFVFVLVDCGLITTVFPIA